MSSLALYRDLSAIPAGQTDFLMESLRHAQAHPCSAIIAATADQAAALSYFLTQQGLQPVLFPDLELMPYDQGSVSAEIIEERYRCLYTMATTSEWIVISSPFALGLRLRPWLSLMKEIVFLNKGQAFDRNKMIDLWVQQGYTAVCEVSEPYEFSVRGEIIDWFPVGQSLPLRLTVPEAHLECIRTFDPQTQRSIQEIPSNIAFPSSDITLGPQDWTKIIARFRRDFSDRSSVFYKQLIQNQIPQGFTFFLPLLLSDGELSESLWTHIIAHKAAVFLHPQAQACHDTLLEKAVQCFEHAKIMFGFHPYPPKRLYIDSTAYADITPVVHSGPHHSYHSISSAQNINLQTIFEQMDQNPAIRICFTVLHAPKIALLESWLQKHNLARDLLYVSSFQAFEHAQSALCWSTAPFEEICQMNDTTWFVPYTSLVQQTLVIPECSAKGRQKQRSHKIAPQFWSGVQYVVHEDHGIGRYHGLKILNLDGHAQEFVELEYADNGRLYLPVNHIEALTPYQTLSDLIPELHKLGQSKWLKEREKAQVVARDHAAELLEIYAKRSKDLAFAHSIPSEYMSFAQEFPFQETCDQEQAIEEVLGDLTKTQPMDRLICGDVGFGKTEVALRACFVSAMNHKQVVLLTPTTLLAQQHYETLIERMNHWGLSIALLSRHTKNESQILKKIAEGHINIIVGTHKLLQDRMKYCDLGLMIVDEEHRFGVRDKERLKKMRGHIHLLSMTATPIPRTLSMSLQGLRDLSLIATPPLARRKIITTLHQNTHDVLKQAIDRELFRRGQVYFLCNDITLIPKKVALIQALCPQARVGFVHGQMPHGLMEHQMHLFYQHALDVLVCTTIIETGIDVAKAHTIVIENAQDFGLAQLHQLRGRVGRSHHQAYAYCLLPCPLALLPTRAAARLEALTLYQDLGSGYQIATHDLELRGAGEILGARQSGHIHQMGLDYYQKLLHKASQHLAAVEAPPLQTLKLDFGLQPCISEKCIPNPLLRMKLYGQWAAANTVEAIILLEHAFQDRFGAWDRLTVGWKNYHYLRVLAIELGLSELCWSAIELKIGFHKSSQAMDLFITWLQKGMLKASPKSPLSLSMKIATLNYEQRVTITQKFLTALERKQAVLESTWSLP